MRVVFRDGLRQCASRKCENDRREGSRFCSDECRDEAAGEATAYQNREKQAVRCKVCNRGGRGVGTCEQAGWTGIALDVEGAWWNYQGTCPDCLKGPKLHVPGDQPKPKKKGKVKRDVPDTRAVAAEGG